MSDCEITVRANGPYRVTGEFTLKDMDGNVFHLPEKEWISLCRCGHSKTKPFCDGSHKAAGFESEEKAR